MGWVCLQESPVQHRRYAVAGDYLPLQLVPTTNRLCIRGRVGLREGAGKHPVGYGFYLPTHIG